MKAGVRAVACAISALVLVTGLAGCGSVASGGMSEAGTVSITHRFGTTEIPQRPERVVALSGQWLDALLALGIAPAGYARDQLADDDGLFSWQEELVGEAAPISFLDDGGVPFEQIAALEPDLILADYSAGDQEVYEQLNAVAPTLGMLGNEQVDPWERQLAVVGDIYDQGDEAADIIDRVNGAVAQTAADLPGLAGKTAVLSQFMFDSNQIVAVADPEDGAATLFYALGMSWPERLVEEAKGTGRLIASAERVDVLRSDLLIMWPNGGSAEDLASLPGFTNLPAVQSGGFAPVDVETVIALNTPSALSIEWVLQSLRPQLECAAGEC